MTEQIPSGSDPRELLRRYASALRARIDTLEGLRQATREIRAALETSPNAEIEPLLERRDRDCRRLDLLLHEAPNFAEAADLLGQCDDQADDELGSLARIAAALRSDSEEIARDIMQCQAECQLILRGRLEEVAGALRESVRRRRLDAAYGPACKHSTPQFLDRQQ